MDGEQLIQDTLSTQTNCDKLRLVPRNWSMNALCRQPVLSVFSMRKWYFSLGLGCTFTVQNFSAYVFILFFCFYQEFDVAAGEMAHWKAFRLKCSECSDSTLFFVLLVVKVTFHAQPLQCRLRATPIKFPLVLRENARRSRETWWALDDKKKKRLLIGTKWVCWHGIAHHHGRRRSSFLCTLCFGTKVAWCFWWLALTCQSIGLLRDAGSDDETGASFWCADLFRFEFGKQNNNPLWTTFFVAPHRLWTRG